MTKLSPTAFVQTAIDNADITRAEVNRLRERLDRHDSFDISEARAAVRRLVRFVRLPNVRAPPGEERRVRWACSPTALAALSCSALELLALASLEATERYPQDFGAEAGVTATGGAETRSRVPGAAG